LINRPCLFFVNNREVGVFGRGGGALTVDHRREPARFWFSPVADAGTATIVARLFAVIDGERYWIGAAGAAAAQPQYFGNEGVLWNSAVIVTTTLGTPIPPSFKFPIGTLGWDVVSTLVVDGISVVGQLYALPVVAGF
jgi:hypothetical protein